MLLDIATKIWNGLSFVLGLNAEGLAKTGDYYHRLRCFFFKDAVKEPQAANVRPIRVGLFGGAFLLSSTFVMAAEVVSGLNALGLHQTMQGLRGIKHLYFGGGQPWSPNLRPGLLAGLLGMGAKL